MTVTVDEGASFDLGEVKLEGEWPVPAKDLLKAAGFKAGDLANFDDVNDGIERMKEAGAARGVRAGRDQGRAARGRREEDGRAERPAGVGAAVQVPGRR